MGFLDENGLISKTKSIFLSLSNVISRSSMFPSPMQIRETQRTASTCKHCHKRLGLKTLIYEHGTFLTHSPTQQLNPLIIHSYTKPQSSSPPSSSTAAPSSSSEYRFFDTHSSWTFGMDDILGTESGVYMISSTFEFLEMDHKQNDFKRKTKPMRKRVVEYPPPIPLLARTGNLQGHMPWILARYYGNGRLVLKEEKVKHHDYFEAYRENGHLILELVSLDASFRCCHTVFEENDDEDEDEEIELEELEFYQGYQEIEKVEEDEESDGTDDEEENNIDEKVNRRSMTSALSVPEFCHWGETYGEPRKCLSLTNSGRIMSEPSSIVSQC